MKNILLLPNGSQAMILLVALAWPEIEFHRNGVLRKIIQTNFYEEFNASIFQSVQTVQKLIK